MNLNTVFVSYKRVIPTLDEPRILTAFTIGSTSFRVQT